MRLITQHAAVPGRPPSSAARPSPEVSRARLVLMSAYAANGLLLSTWFSRLPALADRLHIKTDQLAVVTIALTVATLAAIPVAARNLPSWRATRIVRITLPLTPVAMLIAVTSTRVWQLVAALVLLGAVNGIQGVGLNAHATTLSRLAGRQFMPSMIGTASAAGVFGAGLATLATAVGVPLILHLSVVAGLCLVTGLAVSRQIPVGGGSSSLRIVSAAARQTAHRMDVRRGRPLAALRPRRQTLRGPSGPGGRPAGRLASAPTLRRRLPGGRSERSGMDTGRDPVMRLLVGAGLGATVAEGGIATFAIVIFRDVIGADLAVATLAFTVFSIAMASVRFGGERLMRLIGARACLSIGGILAALSGLLLTGAPNLPLAFLALTGIAAGIACAVPVTLQLATDHAQRRARALQQNEVRATARALSRLGLATGGGYLAGGPILGFVAAVVGLRSSILLVAIGGAALAACAAALTRAETGAVTVGSPANPLESLDVGALDRV